MIEKFEAEPSARPSRIWYPVLLMTLVSVFNYMDRMALPVMLPAIKADLRLSDGQLGLLVGIAFSLFYAICGIPIARWADRGIRRDIIATCLAFWSLMTALTGFAQSFWQLFLARVGVGAGEAGGLVPGHSIICDCAPASRRAGLFAIHTLGGIIGTTLGLALAGWLSETIGWRWAFVTLGLPGIVLAAIVRLTLTEPVRGAFDKPVEECAALSFDEIIRILWKCRTFRLLVIYLVLNNFVQFGLNQWWPSYYARTFGLSSSIIGTYLGVATGFGAGIGLLIGGFLSDKAALHDVMLPIRIGAGIKLLECAAASGALLASSAMASIAFIALVSFFWSLSTAAVLAAVYSVVRPSIRVTAGAISTFLISLLGIGLGPLAVGLLSDYLALSYGIRSLGMALIAPLTLLPISALILWMSASHLPNDLEAAGARP